MIYFCFYLKSVYDVLFNLKIVYDVLFNVYVFDGVNSVVFKIFEIYEILLERLINFKLGVLLISFMFIIYFNMIMIKYIIDWWNILYDFYILFFEFFIVWSNFIILIFLNCEFFCLLKYDVCFFEFLVFVIENR